MKICTCNNCGGVFDDTNPSNKSVDYPEMLLSVLDNHNCPVCKCDDYLVDNINENTRGEALKLHTVLDGIGKAGYSVNDFNFI